MSVQLRPATPADYPTILDVWRRSVTATHDFLTPADIDRIGQEVPKYLDHVQLTVALAGGKVVGFIGVAVDSADATAHASDDARQTATSRVVSASSDQNQEMRVMVEMLFVDPAHSSNGIGSALLQHATDGYTTALVDVNEQNPAAFEFYKRRGFQVVGRSERDGQGEPFPILHLRRTSLPVSVDKAR